MKYGVDDVVTLDDGKEYTMRYFEDNTEKANTTRYQSSNTKRIASVY